MSDLVVVALLPAKPGSEQIVREALTKLVGATRQEPGCRRYDLFESAAEPGTFVTVEGWDSQDDLDAHMQTDHIKEAFAVAGDHLASAPVIHPLKPVEVAG